MNTNSDNRQAMPTITERIDKIKSTVNEIEAVTSEIEAKLYSEEPSELKGTLCSTVPYSIDDEINKIGGTANHVLSILNRINQRL